MAYLTKRTRHLATIANEDINESNIFVNCFQSESESDPKIPEIEKNYFALVCSETGGLFVQGGDIILKGRLKHVFQEYEHLKSGFTDWKIIWFKSRFKGPEYITFYAWIIDKSIAHLYADEGSMHGYLESGGYLTHEIQIQTFKKIIEMVRDYPLPNPPITYDFY